MKFIEVHEFDITVDGKDPQIREVFLRTRFIYKVFEMKFALTRGNNKESTFTSVMSIYGHATWVKESVEEIMNLLRGT